MTHPHHPRGQFITFEGGEGAGKSTQVKLLADALRRQGKDVVLTREPGGSPFAEKIRAYILEGKARKFGTSFEALLFAIARADHVRKVIRPALCQGHWVLCDRFSDSTLAYQGYLGNVSRRFLQFLDAVAVGKNQPDTTLILDLPAEEGLARAHQRAALDRFEAEDASFHVRLREAFLDIAANNPQRCVVIDAQGDIASIAEAIKQALQNRYPEMEEPHREEGA